ncbi:MAG: NAD(P)/FAD-dependent oxidoreductase [Zavarzinella sp.]|nr:NAD(P)/FAD-dependent oxidoreductase [Zavarzinella sp.]
MTGAGWDVVVLGAGAAGLLAAIHAAERGRRTLVLEKNRKPGVKILMSGGTRCNITHDCDNRGIVAAYGAPGKFLHSALAALSVRETIAFFEAEGVATKVEETGKVFPVSNKALDVLDALLRRLRRSGATLALEEPATDLRKPGESFEIATPQRLITVPRVIVTTGGQSYPGSGTRGDGYAWAARFGHTIVAPKPALVPLTVAADWVAALRGVTLADVGVRVSEQGKLLLARRGGFLFAHFGLSGPAPLDVSKAVSRHPNPQSLELELDFLPSRSEPELDEFLRTESLASGKKQLAVVLSELLPRRLCDTLLTLTGQPIDRKAAGLSKTDRQKLVQAIKSLRLPIRGTLGFEKAEVTSGGVSLDEVDSRTMESKLCPGLFLAGEILDLDGPIGGYNFQAAWSTGWLAGRSV